MVWWTDSDRYSACKSKFFYYETSVDVFNDRIFQSTNIMYSLDSSSYDKHVIFSLTKCGVNLFNVDRTVHGEEFFQKIKKVVNDSQNLPEMFPVKYRCPVGLAITMTITDPVDIDESVDTVILKDVNSLNELFDFKKKHKNISVPVMLWIESWDIEDVKQMIQFTDGVFIYVTKNTAAEPYLEVIDLCKKAYKSVFVIIDDIIKKDRLLSADDLHILAIATNIVKHQFDGVLVLGSNDNQNNECQLIRSLVRAMDIIENKTKRDFYKLSLTIKTPVLPWIATSLAASLAAKQSEASAIIVLTFSGTSARWIANASTPRHIVAITTRKETARRLHLYRKVIPLLYDQTFATNWSQECWNRVNFGTTVALDIRLCRHGDKVVVLAPSDQDIKYCNSLRIVSLPMKCGDLIF